MLRRSLYNFLLFLLVLPLIWLQHTGCWKEYSFEGRDSTQVRDTTAPIPTPLPAPNLSSCALCKTTDPLEIEKWNFKIDNAFLCGSSTSSGFMGSYEIVTLFGPSACSIDTGLVINAALPVPLTEDRFNITASKVDFYYYDRFSPWDIFYTRNSNQFFLTIESYIHATGIAIGSFQGTVFKPSGDTAVISEGKFMIKVR